MIAVFPVASDLSLADYQLLLQIAEDANTKSVPVQDWWIRCASEL